MVITIHLILEYKVYWTGLQQEDGNILLQSDTFVTRNIGNRNDGLGNRNDMRYRITLEFRGLQLATQ